MLQKQALQFLINGLSMEADTRVRGAILDALADLRPGSPSQAALDAGLRTAVERNRSLARSVVDNWRRGIAQEKKKMLTKFKITGLDVGGMSDAIPAQVVAALTTEQYLALLDSEHGRFHRLDQSEYVQLTGLSMAIQTLVARGATSTDFKDIYCEECNFSAARSLDGAIFDGADLVDANFAHVSLRGASFKDADLGGTNFFGADLTKADLRLNWFRRGFASKGYGHQLPLLECAKLGGADLSGQPLVLFIKDFNTTVAGRLSYRITLPRMISAQLDTSTKLDKFRILTAIEISDDYLKQNAASPEVQYLTTQRNRSWENPLAKGWWQDPDFRRIHGIFAEDAAKYTHTTAMMDWEFGADELKRLDKEAFMLRGFVDQPALKTLPLYSRFVETVAALNAPEDGPAKAAQARSNNAAKAWATMKPLSCSEHPEGRRLLFDLGSHAATYAPE